VHAVPPEGFDKERMSMKLYFLPLALLMLWMCAGCEVINPREEIPTYIHIDSFRFVPRGDTFGTSSHRISSVWVYLDNQPVGAFEMPVNVPLLLNGPGVVTIAPGIDYNGMKSFQYPYPFYSFDSLQLQPQPGKVVPFDAKTQYVNATRVVYNSNFDLGNPFTKFNGDTTIMKTSTPEYVFEGGGAGFIYIDGPRKTSENISLDPFTASGGEQTFVEINYKGTLAFQVGVAAFFNNGDVKQEYIGGVYPRSEWNKIYLSLREFVTANQGGQFYLIIRAGTDDGESSGWVAIDNIKIVTF
jgi:hypothetical protein